MGWLATITQALRLASEWLGFRSKKLDLNNQEDVKDAAKKQSEVDQSDAASKAVKDQNTDDVRKGLSE